MARKAGKRRTNGNGRNGRPPVNGESMVNKSLYLKRQTVSQIESTRGPTTWGNRARALLELALESPEEAAIQAIVGLCKKHALSREARERVSVLILADDDDENV